MWSVRTSNGVVTLWLASMNYFLVRYSYLLCLVLKWSWCPICSFSFVFWCPSSLPELFHFNSKRVMSVHCLFSIVLLLPRACQSEYTTIKYWGMVLGRSAPSWILSSAVSIPVKAYFSISPVPKFRRTWFTKYSKTIGVALLFGLAWPGGIHGRSK